MIAGERRGAEWLMNQGFYVALLIRRFLVRAQVEESPTSRIASRKPRYSKDSGLLFLKARILDGYRTPADMFNDCDALTG